MSTAATLHNKRALGCLSKKNLLQEHRYYVLKMTVNRASTTVGRLSWTILGPCCDIKQQSDHPQPCESKEIALTSRLCPKFPRQQSVNDFLPFNMENL
jgi:hypothetical protein